MRSKNTIYSSLIVAFVLFASTLLLTACSTPEQAAPPETVSKPLDLEQTLLQNGYTKVQLKILGSAHLCMDININGVNGRFILDTGAGQTVVETDRQEKFKLSSEERGGTAAGAGGSHVKTLYSGNNTVIAGDSVTNNYSFLLMSMEHINGQFRKLGIEEVDGLLGSDFLLLNKAVIDYSKLTVYLKQ